MTNRSSPLPLEVDRDFTGFVTRMFQNGTREHFSDEQLTYPSSPSAKRRAKDSCMIAVQRTAAWISHVCAEKHALQSMQSSQHACVELPKKGQVIQKASHIAEANVRACLVAFGGISGASSFQCLLWSQMHLMSELCGKRSPAS
eukprot:CAMPEP_0172892038 /NCGR_PEP_ID=MMETSP1075-20121228/145310_1 /TAXON_ID=2916 /ORGANISM="Ceratium fusus, Strain PA161109" /LENGTH=143 /DNA_ID=CAMNT_0013746605 /DNA_START=18 /DNA_END=447 /DNA_ORIENTATION=-